MDGGWLEAGCGVVWLDGGWCEISVFVVQTIIINLQRLIEVPRLKGLVCDFGKS